MPRSRLPLQLVASVLLAGLLWMVGHVPRLGSYRSEAAAVLAWGYPHMGSWRALLGDVGVTLPAGLAGGAPAPSHAQVAMPPRLKLPLAGALLSDGSSGMVLAAAAGEPADAAASGKIVSVRVALGRGFVVVEQLPNGWSVSYSGLGPVLALSGSRVRQGEIIGYVAHPRASRPELVITAAHRGTRVDPLTLMQP